MQQSPSAATARRVRIAACGAKPSPGVASLPKFLGFVHAEIREPVGVLVEFAGDVLERDAPDLMREQGRLCVERLQPRMLHLEAAAHLLDEQLRIGLDVDGRVAVFLRPAQRRQQAVVFRDVVGGDADPAVQLVEERTVGPFDVDAVARGAWIAPRTAIDVGGDQDAWVAASCGRK